MKRCAVILKGISYMEQYDRGGKIGIKYVNYKDYLENNKKYIFDDLKNNNHEVDIFLYTYNSIMNDEILKDYNPTCYEFIEYNDNLDRNKAQPLNNINSINMFYKYADDNNIKYDFVIFTRFDLKFSYGITKFGFKQGKLNIGNTNDVENKGICCDLIISSQELLEQYKKCSEQVYKGKIKHLHVIYEYLKNNMNHDDIIFLFKRYENNKLPYNMLHVKK